jgi:hypothetical protein
MSCDENIRSPERLFETFFECFKELRWNSFVSSDDFDFHDLNEFHTVTSPGSSIRHGKRTKRGDEFATNDPQLLLFDRLAITVAQWQMNFVFPH